MKQKACKTMKKKIIIINALLIFLCSCYSTQEKQEFSPLAEKNPSKLYKEIKVTVKADSNEIPTGKKPKDVLIDKAEKKGMDIIFNSWLKKRLIIKVTEDNVFSKKGDSHLLTYKNNAPVQKDELTDMYQKDFKISASLYGVKDLSGDILDFENEKEHGCEYNFVLIDLKEVSLDDKGAYFVVTRPEKIKGKQFYRLMGSGKIFHQLGSEVQGLIMETNRELSKEDVVFLVEAEIESVQNTKKQTLDRRKQDIDEVMVRPVKEKEPPETPSEPK